MSIRIGPVLGDATDSSATVWLEWREGGRPRLRLEDGRTAEAQPLPAHPHAGVYRVTGLEPDKTYFFTFEPADPAFPGPFRLRTLPRERAEGAIAIVSCHESKRYGTEGIVGEAIWQDLYDQLEQEKIWAVLHVGDQVYADKVWDKISDAHYARMNKGQLPVVAIERWCKENRNRWVEAYRNLYREAWRPGRGIAKVLGGIPNLMMWDDHDIHDGYGSRRTDRYLPHTRVAEVARQVYEEYQHPLNPPRPSEAGMALAWTARWPGIEFLALDLRSERRYHVNPSQILGEAQWQAIQKWRRGRAPHDPTDAESWGAVTLIVASTPPVLFGNTDAAPYVFIPDLIDDLRDQWIHEANVSELDRFLRFCDSLVREKNTKLVILSGDIHIHHLVKCTRREDGSHLLYQITSSPMFNAPVSGRLKKIVYDHASLEGRTHPNSPYDGGIIPGTLIDRCGYAILRWAWDGARPSLAVRWRTVNEKGRVTAHEEILLA